MEGVSATIRRKFPDNKGEMTIVNDASAEPKRRQRADARRNLNALLDAAKTVFAAAGVDAPAKEITDLAGVGVGTLYRHFPRRTDLVVAVVQRDIDVCAEGGRILLADDDPWRALTEWLRRYTVLLGMKRGLASALHSPDPAFEGLRAYFDNQLEPVVTDLLARARSAGVLRDDVTAIDVLQAVALLCQPLPAAPFTDNQRLAAVFADGLRRRGRPNDGF